MATNGKGCITIALKNWRKNKHFVRQVGIRNVKTHSETCETHKMDIQQGSQYTSKIQINCRDIDSTLSRIYDRVIL